MIHHGSISVDSRTAHEIAKNQYDMVYAAADYNTRKILERDYQIWISTRARFIRRNGARKEWLQKFARQQ